MPLQLREGYALEQVTQRTPRDGRHVLDDVRKQVVAYPTHDVPRHTPHYPEQKPIEDLTPRCSSGRRQYDRPAGDCVGFGERRQLPAYARTGGLPAPTQHGDSPLCVRLALIDEGAQFVYDEASFGAVHLTNLPGYFRRCLQSSALRFREFQSKFLPFRSPVTGL
jgi:hypothetical protein